MEISRNVSRLIIFLFLAFNIVIFAIGFYMYAVYGLYRLLIVFSLLNILMFRLFTYKEDAKIMKIVPNNHYKTFVLFILSFLVLVYVITLSGVYFRPWIVVPLFTLLLTLFISSLIFNVINTRFSLFLSTFLVLLYIAVSIYFVQPSLFYEPLYATVDAYRDYINAVRLQLLGGIESQYMVLERYYRALPVVPLWLAILNIINNVPIQLVHIVLATLNVILSTAVLVLLLRTVIRNVGKEIPEGHIVLFVLLLLLFPTMVEPMFLMQPIRFAMFIELLVILLVTKAVMNSSTSTNVVVATLFLLLVVVPLHITSTAGLFLFFLLIGMVFGSRARKLAMVCVAVLAVVTGIYLVYAAEPLFAFYFAIKAVLSTISELLQYGSLAITYRALVEAEQVKELESFLIALSNSYLLSFLVISGLLALLYSLQQRGSVAKFYKFATISAMFSLVVIGFSYVAQLWRIDLRYFLFPAIPLVNIVLSTLVLQLRKLDFRREVALSLVGVGIVISVVFSPVFFHEHSTYCRMIPTDDETHAGGFVATFLDYSGGSIRQIVADWPYYSYVRAKLWTKEIGVEHRIKIPTIMYEKPGNITYSLYIIREYFNECKTLKLAVPYAYVLAEVEKKSILINKVFDDNKAYILLD